MNKLAVIYDDSCALCRGAAEIFGRRSYETRFLPGNSIEGAELLRKRGQTEMFGKTVIVIDGPDLYIKSTAIGRILRNVPILRPIYFLFPLVPKAWRDLLYDLVAEHRYWWFARK